MRKLIVNLRIMIEIHFDFHKRKLILINLKLRILYIFYVKIIKVLLK